MQSVPFIITLEVHRAENSFGVRIVCWTSEIYVANLENFAPIIFFSILEKIRYRFRIKPVLVFFFTLRGQFGILESIDTKPENVGAKKRKIKNFEEKREK